MITCTEDFSPLFESVTMTIDNGVVTSAGAAEVGIEEGEDVTGDGVDNELDCSWVDVVDNELDCSWGDVIVEIAVDENGELEGADREGELNENEVEMNVALAIEAVTYQNSPC